MNTTMEYEGKSVENALENACRELKIAKDKLQYDVISYGSTGIFGLVGVKKAKIRVTLAQGKAGETPTGKISAQSLVDEAFGSLNGSVQEKKSKNGDKPAGRAPAKNKTDNRKPAPPNGEGKKAASEAAAPRQEKKPVPAIKEESALRQEAETAAPAPEIPEAAESPGEEKASKPSSRNRSRSSRQRNARNSAAKNKKPAVPKEEKPLPPPVSEGQNEDEDPPGPDSDEENDFLDADEAPPENLPPVEVTPEMAARGREVLEKILAHISEEVTIREQISPGRILYNLDSGNPAIIIGKRGQTLEAIQYVVDKIINRDAEGRVRVQLDVEGYIETRKEHLQQLAVKQAEKARRTGKPATIGQMNAHDRRIIHLALKDDRNVRTQSVGEGYYRRLVIFPKKTRRRRSEDNGSEET